MRPETRLKTDVVSAVLVTHSSVWIHTLRRRVGCGAGRVDFTLVQLVVHDDVCLPHWVEDPT